MTDIGTRARLTSIPTIKANSMPRLSNIFWISGIHIENWDQRALSKPCTSFHDAHTECTTSSLTFVFAYTPTFNSPRLSKSISLTVGPRAKMSDAELLTLGLTSRVLLRGDNGDLEQLTSAQANSAQPPVASCRLLVSSEHSISRLSVACPYLRRHVANGQNKLRTVNANRNSLSQP